MDIYHEPEVIDIARVSAITSSQKGLSRIEEIIHFAKQCGYKKIGLVHCAALTRQAEKVQEIFKNAGLEVENSMCKIGNIPQTFLGLNSSSPMCNPIAQAQHFNAIETDMNVLLGLCVGHDTLFFKYSTAPVTVLAVKDRVYKHNPLAALEDLP